MPDYALVSIPVSLTPPGDGPLHLLLWYSSQHLFISSVQFWPILNFSLPSRTGLRFIGGGTASVLNVSNQFYDFFLSILVWHVLNLAFTWKSWKFDQTMVKLLACFGGGFKCNRRVETIEKKHCFMTQIPHEIYRHSRTLQELKLDSNNIKGIGSLPLSE